MSKDIITISLESLLAMNLPVTVLALKGKIRDDTGFRLDLMELTHYGNVLKDEDLLCDQCIGEGSLLRLAIKAPEYSPHPSQVSYEGFVSHTQFFDTAGRDCGDVTSCLSLISLQLKTDSHKYALDLQSLVEVVEGGDSLASMKQTFGYAEAKKRGFVQWTSSHSYARVMLLEVNMLEGGGGGRSARATATSQSAREVLETRRYRYDGITHLYRGGDRHSWQRYTRHTPIPCALSTRPSQQQLTLAPKVPLKPNQEYVVLLMHGGKILCCDEGGGGGGPEQEQPSANGSAGSSTGEALEVLSDHLIFFTTAPAPSSSSTADSSSAGTVSSLVPSPSKLQQGTSNSSSMFKQVEFSISQNFSNHPTFSIIMNNFDEIVPITCMDLKRAICESIGLPVSDQQLVINGLICLSDKDHLKSFQLVRHSASQCSSSCTQHVNRVQLLPLIVTLRNNMSVTLHSAVAASITPYIHSVFPANGTKNVSTHVLIQIQFQSTCHEVALGEDNALILQESAVGAGAGAYHLDSRVAVQCFVKAAVETETGAKRGVRGVQSRMTGEDSSTRSGGRGGCRGGGDMEGALGGEEARKRGFSRWLRKEEGSTTNQKLFVLEVRKGEGEVGNLLRDRYEFSPWRGRNGRYHGGDPHSWQRYTNNEPLSGVVEVFEEEATGRSSVLLRPTKPLKHNTTYALLVANGVEITSHLRAKGGASSSRTEDDALFFFSTEPERSHSVQGEGLAKDSSHMALSSSHHSSVVDGESCEDEDEVGRQGPSGTIAMCYGLGNGGGDPSLCAIS